MTDPQRWISPDIAEAIEKSGGAGGGGGGSGLTLISSGDLGVSPAEYFDVALPGGYFGFVFYFGRIFFSTTDVLAAAFSTDSGTTFLNDTSNADSYVQAYQLNDVPFTGSGAAGVAGGFTDSLANLIEKQDPSLNVGVSGVAYIQAGDTSNYATMVTDTWTALTSGVPKIIRAWYTIVINPSATATPPLVTYNLARFLPYGNGDCNPPTSGHTITDGYWALFGMPEPA